MIHALLEDLKAQLLAKGCPLLVVDGPETTEPGSWGRERIVVEEGDSDSFDPPWTQTNGITKHRLIRGMGVKVSVFAQDPKAGALYYEHRRRLDHVLDLVLASLATIKSVRKGKDSFLPKSGKYFTPDHLEGTKRRGGAAYELTFEMQRAVVDQSWKGEGKPTAEAGTDFQFDPQNSRLVKTAGTSEEPF